MNTRAIQKEENEDYSMFSDFKTTNDTINFYVGFFGSFPHSDSEDLETFINEELQCKIRHDLTKDQNKAVKFYEVSDRRSFDVAYVLTKFFTSKENAQNYIDNKIKETELIARKYFDEIVVIDGDKFLNFVTESIESKEKIKRAEKIISGEFHSFYNEMRLKYKDDNVIMKLLSEMK